MMNRDTRMYLDGEDITRIEVHTAALLEEQFTEFRKVIHPPSWTQPKNMITVLPLEASLTGWQ